MTAARSDSIPRRRWSVGAAVIVFIVGCSPVPSTAPTSPAASIPSANLTPSSTEATFALDAVTWQAVSQPFGGASRQEVRGLFMNGLGELVAWGHEQVVDGRSRETSPTFWSSVDGLRWRETRLGGPGGDLDITDLDHGPRGFVAVGFAGPSFAAWWSPDGNAWSKATPEQSGTDDDGGLSAVIGGTEGFLAVGSDLGRAAAWFSAEGESWTRVGPDFPAGYFRAVSEASDGGFVVVGMDHSQADWDGVAWVVSADGQDWQPANANEALAGPNDDHLRRVWSFARGYVAFGQERDPDTRHCLTCSFDRKWWRIYTSPDGLTWDRHVIDFEPATGEPVPAEFNAVKFNAIEPWADGLIAVGRGTDDLVRVWLSRDGVTWAPVGNPVALGALAANEPSVADLLVVDRQLVIGGSIGDDDGYLVIGTAP